MTPVRCAVPAAFAVIALAACGSSPVPASTAAQLAGKIPGCTGLTVNTPQVSETQDVTCGLPDGVLVNLVTFPSPANETAWIASGGDPAVPDPIYVGCCIEGTGWAAAFSNAGAPGDWDAVEHALGGKTVTG